MPNVNFKFTLKLDSNAFSAVFTASRNSSTYSTTPNQTEPRNSGPSDPEPPCPPIETPCPTLYSRPRRSSDKAG